MYAIYCTAADINLHVQLRMKSIMGQALVKTFASYESTTGRRKLLINKTNKQFVIIVPKQWKMETSMSLFTFQCSFTIYLSLI